MQVNNLSRRLAEAAVDTVAVYHGIGNNDKTPLKSLLKQGFKRSKSATGFYGATEDGKRIAQYYSAEQQGAHEVGDTYKVVKFQIPKDLFEKEFKRDPSERKGAVWAKIDIPPAYIESVQTYKISGKKDSFGLPRYSSDTLIHEERTGEEE